MRNLIAKDPTKSLQANGCCFLEALGNFSLKFPNSVPHGLFGQRVSFVSSGIITFTTQAPGAEQKVALIERCNTKSRGNFGRLEIIVSNRGGFLSD